MRPATRTAGVVTGGGAGLAGDIRSAITGAGAADAGPAAPPSAYWKMLRDGSDGVVSARGARAGRGVTTPGRAGAGGNGAHAEPRPVPRSSKAPRISSPTAAASSRTFK